VTIGVGLTALVTVVTAGTLVCKTGGKLVARDGNAGALVAMLFFDSGLADQSSGRDSSRLLQPDNSSAAQKIIAANFNTRSLCGTKNGTQDVLTLSCFVTRLLENGGMETLPLFLEQWLKDFAAAVQTKNFTAGKILFADNVVSFGTVCGRAESLFELSGQQWQAVWPRTDGFDFDYTTARAMLEQNQAVVVAGWQSTGYTRDKKPFPRRGRATIALRKSDDKWLAIHTHFSSEPSVKDDPLFRSL